MPEGLIAPPRHNFCNGICEGCTLYPECPTECEDDPMDETPYPLLCCMCRFRGEDRTEIDIDLPSILDSVSCHHPEIENDFGRQGAIARCKNCVVFERRVIIRG